MSDDDVLSAVREHWLPAVDEVEYLPVGFGAHHWLARADAESRLFVTLDGLRSRTVESLEASYAAAAALHDAGLEFVVRCVPSSRGTLTVPLAGDALSVTGWVDGRRPADVSPAVPLVRRLHATTPPSQLPRWAPLVTDWFATRLDERLRVEWSAGPFAVQARESLRAAMPAIEKWTAAYHRLADDAYGRAWVATHGEPHERNLLMSTAGPVLVDWESLRLAPAERDLRVVDPSSGDAPMLEMFDLEWRLDEIAQYAEWFEEPHDGTEDDRIALGGLMHELTRP